MKKNVKKVQHFFILSGLSFLSLVILSLIWNIEEQKSITHQLAKVEALGNYNNDLTFRRWASMHGGVYVPVNKNTKPNKHLDFVPKRDVVTSDGDTLTLINPAYMTRLAFELELAHHGSLSHITSLNPINQENKADKWEQKALKQFKKGVKEYSGIFTIDNKEYMRYMRPIFVEKSCLKCHAQQGYQINEIRGGISVSIPMERYNAILDSEIIKILQFHAFMCFLLLLLGWLAYRRTIKSVKAQYKSQDKVLANEKLLIKQNKELVSAKNKAEESDRLKTIFLQNMSHEIRTPMNAILGFASLIPDEFDNKNKLAEYTSIINQRGNDLLCILNDLLDVSRIESQKLEIHPEKFLLKDLLMELCTICQANQEKYNKYHIQTVNPFDSCSNKIMLYTDQGKLKQIFSNLINNAFKFTSEGVIEIGFRIREKEIEFWVSDTGIGIPSNQLKNIFQRFTQIDLNSTRLNEGTGLGLSIVKGLILLLKGEIRVESTPGKGSRFTFSLPLSSLEIEQEIQQTLEFKE